MITVNGQEAEPGCWIDGHWGQYGVDRLASICEDFGIELLERDTPAYWRARAEYISGIDDTAAGNYWEAHHEAGDTLEEELNNRTEGGYWTWEDGEFYLFDSELTCDGCGKSGNRDDMCYRDEECPDEDCEGRMRDPQ